MHVELIQHVDAFDRNARRRNDRACLPAGGTHTHFERQGLKIVEHQVDGLHHVMAQVREHAAEC